MVLSEYEQARADKMAANQAKLASLGLAGPSLLKKPDKQVALKKRKPPAKTRPPGSRSSPRLASSSSSSSSSAASSVVSAKSARLVRPASWQAAGSSDNKWSVSMFASLAQASAARSVGGGGVPSTGNRFDPRRSHQHLTHSPDGRSVATTGVAGYGVALCQRTSSSSSPSPSSSSSRWFVACRRLGVGGFSVGVVSASSIKAPYKSLGSHPSSLGAYHSSGVYVCSGVSRAFGTPYGEGDVVAVVLRDQVVGRERKKADKNSKEVEGGKEIVFEVNGREVGTRPVAKEWLKKGAGDLLLAVQPYMGGVAELC